MRSKLAGVIATAAAVAFITAPITSTVASAHKVPCYLNKCSGKADNKCKTVMKKMSKKKCEKKGGSLTNPKEETTAAPEAKK